MRNGREVLELEAREGVRGGAKLCSAADKRVQDIDLRA